ncbi:MAG: penicillin-binding protein 2, partial [Patescibacteria group bacterium]|nr:penicillin-binding protein 2 [Patescibacteria group bacterium]
LEPERGKIFAQDGQDLPSENIYQIATNKEFALVYAVPNKITGADDLAEKLYAIFDHEIITQEVEKLLEDDEHFKENLNYPAEDYKEKEEFRKVKKDLEIEKRKKEIVEKYVKILNKESDPYEPIKNKVDEEKLAAVMELNNPGINYIMENHRYYPEGNLGAHILGFVGYQGDAKIGQYGLEGFFNEELGGKAGSIKTERSAAGGLIIINDREYDAPQDGSDLILSINRSIQFTACEKLNKAVERHGAEGGTIIIMEPYSGAILAMCSSPDYDSNNYSKVEDINFFNNPAIFSQYEPGSIFKAITMAAAIDQGEVTPETLYLDKGRVMIEGWPKPINNSDFETHGGHGWVDMITVLEESLNTGAIFSMEKIGAEIFADYVKKFGFGEKTGIELETENFGNIESLIRSTIRPVEAATASFGQGITVTPLQMITAYAAIANGGMLMKPYLVGKIISGEKNVIMTQPKQIRRVISERSALLLSGMLVNVIEGGHAKKAQVRGYFIGGKTGTAQVADKEKKGYGEQTIHTFVGFGPVDDPKFVMLVKLDDPKDVQYAADSSAPLFGELAEFILNYYQVPKER